MTQRTEYPTPMLRATTGFPSDHFDRQERYEFGCKVSVVTTGEEPWILSVLACHDNPYDGATLKNSLEKAVQHTHVKIELAFADKGYRGKEYHPTDTQVLFPVKRICPIVLKSY